MTVLYQFNELQRMALSPYRMAAQVHSQVLRSPFNPFSETPHAQTLAAMYELFAETTQYHGKPAFGIDQTTIDGRVVPITEEIVHRLTFGQLKHFKRHSPHTDPKLLIVAPMSGHFATLLRGTVETMVKNHDVYITDWRDASNVPLFEGNFDLDDYIDYIREFLDVLGPNTHVMAVCQPGIPVTAAVALMAEDESPNTPLSMTLLGSPMDTRRRPTAPCKLATDHSLEWFERTVIHHVPVVYPGAFRRVYPGFLQLGGFMSMNFERHLEAHMNQFDHLVQGDGDSAEKHRAFYAEYNAVMDLTAEYYLQTIETVFQKQLLAKGEMMYRGTRLINTAAIHNTGLMTVEGELDDISGIGQTVAAHDLCPHIPAFNKVHYEQKGVGHYGVFNGSKFNSEIAPRISEFILRNEPKPLGKLALIAPAKVVKPTEGMIGENLETSARPVPFEATSIRKTPVEPLIITKASPKAPPKPAAKAKPAPAAPKKTLVKAKSTTPAPEKKAGIKKPVARKALKAPAPKPAIKTTPKKPVAAAPKAGTVETEAPKSTAKKATRKPQNKKA